VSEIALSVAFSCCYAEHCYAECRGATDLEEFNDLDVLEANVEVKFHLDYLCGSDF
jgi:hypothetical protein